MRAPTGCDSIIHSPVTSVILMINLTNYSVIPTLTTYEDNHLSTNYCTKLDLEPRTLIKYQDPKIRHPVILTPQSTHLSNGVHQMAEGTSKSQISEHH